MLARPLAKAVFLTAAALAASVAWPAISGASELLMFERKGCVWCLRWDREIGQIYDKASEAKVLPLRRIDLDRETAGGVTLAAPVRYTPTFVVIDNGRETGRITGYVDDNTFWGLLGTFAGKLEAPPEPKRTMLHSATSTKRQPS